MLMSSLGAQAPIMEEDEEEYTPHKPDKNETDEEKKKRLEGQKMTVKNVLFRFDLFYLVKCFILTKRMSICHLSAVWFTFIFNSSSCMHCKWAASSEFVSSSIPS